ncbi:hypothetical protein BU23DRAFT_572309 [Bimuria novae-zelandiae CBS 107.79]|uniref:Uncharacterized protein n=1 Tax=Bimuria novae-zelandiae CBS 107.79 TaxID=1447943 RepID=A0A6A5UTP8_9PLEO|nr:hypothetical protein BU23DRAFT_572309 [Bimuria novae-zelandiae CBS 107.79]
MQAPDHSPPTPQAERQILVAQPLLKVAAVFACKAHRLVPTSLQHQINNPSSTLALIQPTRNSDLPAPLIVEHGLNMMARFERNESAFIFGLLQTAFAALAVVLRILTLVAGIMRLTHSYRKYARRRRERELVFELEAQIPEIRYINRPYCLPVESAAAT